MRDTGQELLLASCSENCCLCPVLRGAVSHVAVSSRASGQTEGATFCVVPNENGSEVQHCASQMSSEICCITDQGSVRTMSQVSSGFAILQTFVERGVYLRQLGVTAPSSVKFVSSQRMGDVEVPRMQCVVRKCARGPAQLMDQLRHVSRHCLVKDCGNRNSGVCEGQVVLK